MKSHQIHAASQSGPSMTDMEKVRANTPYVWDGVDEEDRPLTKEEMQAGIDAFRRQREQSTKNLPAGSTEPRQP